MKHFLIFFMMLSLIIAIGAIAQTTNEAKTPQKSTESTKTPWVYPIAPGVWYPGEPLPEKPFRYYRIRCWPGCHHGGSPYAKYPDEPKTTESTIESSKVPWEYPIAPGVWYPGQPLPEKPFRYYRIRCWPGCHHGGSPYAKYPDEPKTTESITESSKVPWEYPIAPGVWYPGQPLPEKPFRYYRIRCWPGCHHGGSPYAKYPDKPTTDKPTAAPTGGNK